MNALASTCLAIAWISLGTGCRTKVVTCQNDLVTVMRRDSIVPHGMDTSYLYIQSKSFRNLVSRHYLKIPEWESILFVTRAKSAEKYKVHIFNLKTKQDTVIVTLNHALVMEPMPDDELSPAPVEDYRCKLLSVDGAKALIDCPIFRNPDRFEVEIDRDERTLVARRMKK